MKKRKNKITKGSLGIDYIRDMSVEPTADDYGELVESIKETDVSIPMTIFWNISTGKLTIDSLYSKIGVVLCNPTTGGKVKNTNELMYIKSMMDNGTWTDEYVRTLLKSLVNHSKNARALLISRANRELSTPLEIATQIINNVIFYSELNWSIYCSLFNNLIENKMYDSAVLLLKKTNTSTVQSLRNGTVLSYSLLEFIQYSLLLEESDEFYEKVALFFKLFIDKTDVNEFSSERTAMIINISILLEDKVNSSVLEDLYVMMRKNVYVIDDNTLKLIEYVQSVEDYEARMLLREQISLWIDKYNISGLSISL